MPPKAAFGIPPAIVGAPPGQRGVLIRQHVVGTGLTFEIRRGRILRFACQSIVIATDRTMTVNEEAPPRRPRVRGHFRRSGGPVLIAAIAGIPGGMLNFTNAMAFPSGGIDSCLRVICVATPAYAPPPGVSALVSHNWLRSSYRRALDAAWREGCTSIAIPIMGAGRLGYRTHYAADVACRAVHDFFYGNMHHSPARRARFRRVVFFIEDDPNYIPWLREEAAIIEFERQVMTWA